MANLTETQIKQQEKGRKHIAEFLSAMKFHDPDLESTRKLMRNKLREIKQRESSAGSVLIKKPQTVQKVIFKFNGSKTVLHRRSPQTLVSPNYHETDSRNASKTLSSSCKRDQTMINNNNDDETLICKRQKINNNNNYGDDQENLRPTESMSDNNNEGTVMDFIKSVGGSEAELVIEKRLTKSDVSANQGRLLIPMLQVKNRGFLTTDEEIIMMGKKEGIRVSVFDPERRKWTLKLTKWKMSKEYNYVFKTNWNDVVKANGWDDVVKANGLKGEMVIIRVLSFRVDQQLCFALDRVA